MVNASTFPVGHLEFITRSVHYEAVGYRARPGEVERRDREVDD